jgi:aminoglycoside/choline kinase family phosphotransferase
MPPAGSAGDCWVRRESLAGDASTRRYWRLEDRRGQTAILVEYPPDLRAALARDLEVMTWLAGVGLRLPAVLDRDLSAGRALLEDLGPADAEATLRASPLADRLELAAALLAPLELLAAQPVESLPTWNRPLDAARLRWELAGFELWFVSYRQGVTPDPALDRFLDDLAEQLASHPRRICHRDFHLNNLYLMGSGEVAVIDAQDSLIGPDTYDAASLLEERAMPELLGDGEREDLRRAWAQRTRAADGWERRWPRVRVQRALKVLGTFARLEAAGRTAYTGWMGSIAGRLAADADALALPGAVVDRLLDWEG